MDERSQRGGTLDLGVCRWGVRLAPGLPPDALPHERDLVRVGVRVRVKVRVRGRVRVRVS